MDHDRTPVLEAIEQYRRSGNYTFSLPGHRFGRGIDDRTAAMLNRSTFEVGVIMAKEAVDYLRSGVAAGMRVPDASDPKLKTLRVVRG